jgi:HAD superfamily hydrolase (TIGR01509 family)
MIFRNKEAIICDMDGTLIDSIPLWNLVDEEIIVSFGKVPHASVGNERTKFLSENTTGDIYRNYGQFLVDTYGFENTTAEAVAQMRCDISRDFHENKMDYKDGADEFLRKAKEKNYKLLLASSTSKWVIGAYTMINKNMMKKANMRDIFDVILTREDVALKKPNPEIYRVATKLSGCEPHRVIAIEDELVGVKAASGAGIEVIAMYDKYADVDREYIKALANYSVNDFHKLIKKL